MSLLHWDLMVSMIQIHTGHHAGMLQSIKQVIDSGNRILAQLSKYIQLSVFYYHTQTSIFLPNEDKRSPKWTDRWPNPPLTNLLVQLLPNLQQLGRTHPINPF